MHEKMELGKYVQMGRVEKNFPMSRGGEKAQGRGGAERKMTAMPMT